MKSNLFRSTLVLISLVTIVSSALFFNVSEVFAYRNYDDCVYEQSITLGGARSGGSITDAELTQIETSCRQEFPASTAASPRATSRTTTRTSSSPAPRASSNTSPAPSSSSSATPTVSSSSAPTASSSSLPTSTSSSNSPSSSSTNTSGTTGDRSGAVIGPMFGNRADPNSIFRDPPQGANVDGINAGQYAQPLIQLSDRQLAFQILVNFFLGIISVVCLLFLVFNGYRYALARGEDNQISQAKKGITYAIIGLILVLAAYTIVATILNFGAQSGPGIGISVGVQL